MVFERDGEPIAGCMKNDGSMGPSTWSVYLASADAGATAEKAKEHGGQVVVGPMQVGEMGRMAFVVDPAGAVRRHLAGARSTRASPAAATSARRPGSRPSARTTTPRCAFYREVFGWDTHTMSDTDGVPLHHAGRGTTTRGPGSWTPRPSSATSRPGGSSTSRSSTPTPRPAQPSVSAARVVAVGREHAVRPARGDRRSGRHPVRDHGAGPSRPDRPGCSLTSRAAPAPPRPAAARPR